jgi:methionyl-tRNA formyltransferase
VNHKPPRAVVCGYGEMATLGIESLLEAGYAVPLFVTHPDDPGETIWWRSPAALARERGIEVATPERLSGPGATAMIAAAGPDFLFSFYYRSMIGAGVLAIPGRGSLNLHGSLLPRYRGRAPINWVLVQGETTTGVTLHYMDEKPDHGDIVDQVEVPIAFEDTARMLFDKVAAAARVLLRRALPRLAEGTAGRRPQAHDQATYFGRRTPADGRIDWSWPATRIHNLVRAVTHPYPGAFTEVAGRRLLVWSARPAALDTPQATASKSAPATAPGTVMGPGDSGIVVACGEGTLLVRAAQFESGPDLADAAALARALPAGTRLG